MKGHLIEIEELHIIDTPSDIVSRILRIIRATKIVYLKLSQFPVNFENLKELMSLCSSAPTLILKVPYAS